LPAKQAKLALRVTSSITSVALPNFDMVKYKPGFEFPSFTVYDYPGFILATNKKADV